MSIRLTQVELQSEEDTVIFLASGHLNCVEQVKPLLEAENFLEDHDGEDIEVSLSHYLYGDEGPAYVFQPLLQPLAQCHPTLLSQLDTLIHLNTLPELNCQFLLDISIDIAEDGLTVLFVAHYGMCLEIRDGWFTHVVPRTPFGAHRPGCG